MFERQLRLELALVAPPLYACAIYMAYRPILCGHTSRSMHHGQLAGNQQMTFSLPRWSEISNLWIALGNLTSGLHFVAC